MKNTNYNYKPKTKRKMETSVFNFKSMSNPEDIALWEAAEAELPNREDSVKKDVAFLKEVL